MSGRLPGADLTEARFVAALECFVLDADQLSQSASLDEARPAGWRFLVQRGDSSVAITETASDPGGDDRFSRFDDGLRASEFERALRQLDDRLETAGPDYHLRIVRVPSARAVGVWAWSGGEGEDVVYPLEGVRADEESEPIAAIEYLGLVIESKSQRQEWRNLIDAESLSGEEPLGG